MGEHLEDAQSLPDNLGHRASNLRQRLSARSILRSRVRRVRQRDTLFGDLRSAPLGRSARCGSRPLLPPLGQHACGLRERARAAVSGCRDRRRVAQLYWGSTFVPDPQHRTDPTIGRFNWIDMNGAIGALCGSRYFTRLDQYGAGRVILGGPRVDVVGWNDPLKSGGMVHRKRLH